jgi:hypothetical protein
MWHAWGRGEVDPILSYPNSVRPIDSYLRKVHFIIFPPTPRSSQWSLTFGTPNQNPVNISPLPHACHMLRSCQRISPATRRFGTFRNKKHFYGEGFTPTPNPQDGGPPLVGCPWLLFSQLPCVFGGLPSIRILRTRYAVVTSNTLNMVWCLYQNKCNRWRNKWTHYLSFGLSWCRNCFRKWLFSFTS